MEILVRGDNAPTKILDFPSILMETALSSAPGWTVGIEGDVIVVGAPTDSGAGSAWVFTRVAGTWNSGAELDSGETQSQYGMSVAIDNSTIVVGERFDATSNGAAQRTSSNRQAA